MAKSNKYGCNDNNVLGKVLRVKRFLENNKGKWFSRNEIINDCALSINLGESILMCLKELKIINYKHGDDSRLKDCKVYSIGED